MIICHLYQHLILTSFLIDWVNDYGGGRLCLRTAATNGPNVHPPGDSLCEHAERWWWWRRLWITPDSSTRALWQSYQQSHLGQLEGMDEGVRIFPISIWNTSDVQHVVKSYDRGPPALLPVRRNVCCGFIWPLKVHLLGRVWTLDPWVQ
jgi:hypothetical protein